MRRDPDFQIVEETADYLVVDKPPFLLVHPTKPDERRTLWKELRGLLAFEIANGGQVSIVNRLDRETSGLVLVAKNAATARKFGLLMQAQKFHKEYLAIVWGWPEWDNKSIDAPLDRQGKHRPSPIWLKQAIHPEGAPAQTEFRVEQRFTRSTSVDEPSPVASRHPRDRDRAERREERGEGKSENRNFALIRATPRTGRTHQVRVHFASVGHAIVGDKIYGPDERLYLQFIETGWTPELEKQLLLPRQALHASRLVLEGEHDWTCALPVDLAEFAGTHIVARP